ncbi:ROK family protein [Thermincola potens]|uniref:ROK family protein n=1 Tax=Thermincola potens (strain JR) TaxID=635013 RepID=D5XCA3_THEPJ|nr:ROK family protein [Thermincola potens]ADG83555.1 ROK family protein [Thermincola potens JR]
MAGNKEQYVIGIDLGGTFIKGALFNRRGKMLAKKEIPTLAAEGAEAVATRMAGLARDLQKQAGVSMDMVIGMGIGSPGQIDGRTGCVIRSGNLGWHNVYILEMVKKHIPLPLFLENDATAAALGEKWCGAGQQAENMIMMTIGTGIGGGIIINGRLYRGASSGAGEIGHMVIQPGGPLCSCGNKGCLEALAAAPAIIKRAKAALAGGTASVLAETVDFTVRNVFDAVAKGDPVATRVVDETAYYLGIGVGSLINIFNPELVIIGGGVSKAGDLLFIPLCKYAEQNALPALWPSVRIVPAALGNDAGSVGAAAVALQRQGYGLYV